MKDSMLISTTEKTFLIQAVDEHLRLDGRQFNDHRLVKIHFGIEWGSCLVTFGDTRVLAQVSCDIQPPKASKPNEGLLYVHVEMSPMAASHFESGRQSNISVQVNRLLEKCLKESNCLDLEALCIVAEEKVWNIRIDLNVMNYEGNVVGCCSVAALAALAHFRHPDVTSTGDQIIIHSQSEKEPIPINLHHYPVIVSYALFNSGKQIVTDPTAIEEKVADSLLQLSINSYREICGMHFEGVPLPSSDIIVQCTINAVLVATQLVKQVKQALIEDEQRRLQKPFGGLSESLDLDHILARMQEAIKITLKRERPWKKENYNTADSWELREIEEERMETDEDDDEVMNSEINVKSEKNFEDEKESKYSVKAVGQKTAELEIVNQVSSDESESSEEIQFIPGDRSDTVEVQLSGDSEEEEVVVLQSDYK